VCDPLPKNNKKSVEQRKEKTKICYFRIIFHRTNSSFYIWTFLNFDARTRKDSTKCEENSLAFKSLNTCLLCSLTRHGAKTEAIFQYKLLRRRKKRKNLLYGWKTLFESQQKLEEHKKLLVKFMTKCWLILAFLSLRFLLCKLNITPKTIYQRKKNSSFLPHWEFFCFRFGKNASVKTAMI
jgi:hypothetical protein